MEEKTLKQKAKDWWQRNKRVIKVGAVCGFVGVIYGMLKGSSNTNKMWLDHGFERTSNGDVYDDDDFEYTEENVDDPELLELIKNGEVDF